MNDSRATQMQYPRGWFCLGPAHELQPGEAKSLQAFGTRLAYFRGTDGELHLLDGYCPHMGAELGRGCVDGSNLRCPFHHWMWGPQGDCVDIPYAKRIPERARVHSWPIRERNGLALAWYDPAGSLCPGYEIPRIDDCYSEEWTPWSLRSVEIHAHWRELVDNVADKAHFGPVHHAPISFFENEFDAHRAVQRSRTYSDTLGTLDFVATYHGPAYQIGEYTGEWQGETMRARMLNAHLPLDGHSFRLLFGVMVRRTDIRTADAQGFLAEYTERSLATFMQDVDIWMHKRYEEQPVLCDGDGPLHALRKWYAQFYSATPVAPAVEERSGDAVIPLPVWPLNCR